jgi:hypothetical protein
MLPISGQASNAIFYSITKFVSLFDGVKKKEH